MKLARTEKLRGCNVTMVGHSRAGEATGFHLLELNWQLDAGDVRNQKPTHVFVTHGHADHSFQLPYFLSRVHPTHFYVPAEVAPYIKRYIEVAQQLNSFDMHDTAEEKYILCPVKPVDTITLNNGRHLVKVIACQHPVPCVGYCFSEVRQKLKKEFQGLPGQQMAKLKKEGVVVTQSEEIPLFAFLGDTTVNVYTTNEQLLFQYPVIIAECTRLTPNTNTADSLQSCPGPATSASPCQAVAPDANTTESDDDAGHTDWQSLAPVVARHPQTHFYLIHFSLKHRESEIHDFFEEQHKLGFTNVTPWTHK
eukprot:TRINITY_DN4951_c0_g1_i1.p1 TRINITY_DN4951_c0_g1~~TRINITY_DN4951_c0_g1_i1.p1  ORF type:complete len:308 (-),score=79.36 TRINITY_DN4951_c0_g1_i1:7-930(-)